MKRTATSDRWHKITTVLGHVSTRPMGFVAWRSACPPGPTVSFRQWHESGQISGHASGTVRPCKGMMMIGGRKLRQMTALLSTKNQNRPFLKLRHHNKIAIDLICKLHQ